MKCLSSQFFWKQHCNKKCSGSDWTSLPGTKRIVFLHKNTLFTSMFFQTFHPRWTGTCQVWLRMNLALMNRADDSVPVRRLHTSVRVPDRQIRAPVSQWHPGRVPRSQSPCCQTTLKLHLNTRSHIRRHPEPTVYRLRINTWDENLQVAHNRCLARLDVAVIKIVIAAQLNIAGVWFEQRWATS